MTKEERAIYDIEYREKNKEKIKTRRKNYNVRSDIKKKATKRSMIYYQINSEKVKNSIKRWRENNLEKEAEYKRKWRENNLEKVAENKKRYYQKNKKKILENTKKLYEENKEKVLLKRKEYYQKNKEDILLKHREYNKKYYQDNKKKIIEKIKLYRQSNQGRIMLQNKKHKRRVRINNGLSDITTKWLTELKQKTIVCPYCGIWIIDNIRLELDHLTPICSGGTHTKDNVAYICLNCNGASGKWMQTYEEYMNAPNPLREI